MATFCGDMHGKRRMLLVALGLITVGSALGAAAPGIEVLLVVVRRLVAESALRSAGRFDLPGAVGLSAAPVCLLLVVSRGTAWGWTSPTALALAAGAVVLFALWGRRELRTPAPLVDLRVSGDLPRRGGGCGPDGGPRGADADGPRHARRGRLHRGRA